MHTLKLYLKSGDEIKEIDTKKFLKFNVQYNKDSDSIVKI